MKIFDKNSGNEIKPRLRSKISGTNRVIECTLKGPDITNVIFGATSRGIIDGREIPDGISFDNCVFNYVDFETISECTFKNCHFNKCLFTSMRNVVLENCTGYFSKVKNYYSNIVPILSGNCSFINCNGLEFDGYIDFDDTVIKSINCPDLDIALTRSEQRRKEYEEIIRKTKELRKSIKYGYKVVTAPVLVKLSFPEEAEIVNLDKDKSRANMAFVEAVYIVNDFGREGVTNRSYLPSCNYEVGKLVVPDSYDPNPNNLCGHGIHFCKDIESLSEHSYVDIDQIKNIKKKLNL
jgi:hypothetical protein